MSYELLQQVWFGLIAVLWIGYFVLEGFDFGVGILLPVLGKNEAERRALVTTLGPLWDGNEVWLVTAGAATFDSTNAGVGTIGSHTPGEGARAMTIRGICVKGVDTGNLGDEEFQGPEVGEGFVDGVALKAAEGGHDAAGDAVGEAPAGRGAGWPLHRAARQGGGAARGRRGTS